MYTATIIVRNHVIASSDVVSNHATASSDVSIEASYYIDPPHIHIPTTDTDRYATGAHRLVRCHIISARSMMLLDGY